MATALKTEKLLLRIPEAMDAIGVSRATFYKEIGRGAIRTVHIGGAVRVSVDELRRYVSRLSGEGVA